MNFGTINGSRNYADMNSFDLYNNKVQEFVAHSTEVNCLTIGSKSCQVLATGGEDSKVNVWKIGDSSNIWTLSSNKSPIQSLCFDCDEQCVVSGAMNGSIKVFDLNEGRLVRNLNGHQVNVTCLQYHAFGEFIVSGSLDCSMKVWDIRSKTCLQTYTGHEKEITCARFSPDGRWVASSSKDGSLNIWDLVAGKILQSFRISPSYITSFEFNPDEFMLASITSSRTVKLWDLETMKAISYIPPDSSIVKAISFPSQDSSMCVATKDSLKLWNWEPTIKLTNSLDIAWEGLCDMKVTPENKLIAGSFISNFVSIWSIDLNNLPVPQTKAPVTNSSENSSKQGSNKIPITKCNQPPDISPINKLKPTYSFRDSSSAAEDLSDFALKGKSFNINNSNSNKINSTTAAAEPKKPIKSYSFRNQTDESKLNDKIDELDTILEEVTISNNNPPNSPPLVVWESDNAAKDMATSMGESFWKRFQQSQKNKKPIETVDSIYKENDTSTSRGSQIDISDYKNEPEKISDNIITNLRNQLPPAKYDDNRKGTNSTSNSNKNRERNNSYESIDYDDKSSNRLTNNEIITKIDSLLLSNSIYSTILSQRITSLRTLKRYWEKQDFIAIIDHITTIFDTISPEPDVIRNNDNNNISPILQILNDFFNNINFHNTIMITLDNYIEFIKIFHYLIKYLTNYHKNNYKYKKEIINNIDIIIKVFLQLYLIFGDTTKQSKLNNVNSNGIDLVREERLEKYIKINDIINNIKNNIIIISNSFDMTSTWITKFMNTIE